MIFRHLSGFLRNHGRISKGALERSLSTSPSVINPRFQKYKRTVVTLDPSKFAEKKQLRLRIDDQSTIGPVIMLHNQSISVCLRYDHTGKPNDVYIPFPPYTKAFLYYFKPPKRPRIGGEIRLRVASSDDHAAFENGSDLLKPNGLPWSRSLYQVSKAFIPLYEKLREDGFVPDELNTVLSAFPPKKKKFQGQLYTLNDTFLVDFSSRKQKLTIITEKGIEWVELHHTFSESRTSRISPYIGSALVRFERSALPIHKGTRTVVLRIFRTITPLKCVIPRYDDYIVPPKDGQLHQRGTNYSSTPQVWSADIDQSASLRGLQLLWDI